MGALNHFSLDPFQDGIPGSLHFAESFCDFMSLMVGSFIVFAFFIFYISVAQIMCFYFRAWNMYEINGAVSVWSYFKNFQQKKLFGEIYLCPDTQYKLELGEQSLMFIT